MNDKVSVAAVQMTSVEDWQVNLRKAEDLVKEAAARGAQIVALPENFAYLRAEGEQIPCAQSIEGEFIQRMKALTAEHRIYLLCGTIPEKTEGAQIYNTSVLLDPAGRAIAVYRKIHLFDVNLPGRAVFQESKLVRAGHDLVTAQTEFGTVGLTVCYDLRFPELFRRLTLSGARMIFVPSAFTEYTGKDHWEVLLRARAIENQVYIIAPAQFGQHNPKRRSYGKALIVDPWGTVLAKAADQEGVILADVDFHFQDKIRRELPCLEHIRLVD
jgi:predicted amidohydrolase